MAHTRTKEHALFYLKLSSHIPFLDLATDHFKMHVFCKSIGTAQLTRFWKMEGSSGSRKPGRVSQIFILQSEEIGEYLHFVCLFSGTKNKG